MFQKRNIIVGIWVVVLFCAVGLATRAGAAVVQGPGLLPGGGPGHLLRMAKVVLGLTDPQAEQIQGIVHRNLETARPLLDQLHQTHEAFQQAIEKGQTDTATLQPLADQVGRTVSQLALIRARAAVEVHAVLTPEQQAKAKQVHEQIRDHMRQRWMQ